MRILLVSDYYPPYLGGAQRQLQLIAKELSARGYQVGVVSQWHPGMPMEKTEDSGETIFRVKQLRTLFERFVPKNTEQHSPSFPDPVMIVGLRRIINRFQPDVIYSYGWIGYSLAVALTGKKTPLVVSSRDYGYSCATRELLYQGKICEGPELSKCFACSREYFGTAKGTIAYLSVYFSRPFLLSRVSGIHSVSAYVRDINRRDWVGKRQDKLAVNGGNIRELVAPSFLINAPNREDDEAILERLPKEPYILFVGGLQPRKGIKPLLEAYKRLASPPPLVLIGYLVPDAPKEFPPNVTVLQNVPHNQVMTAWKNCLFGVTPSLWADPSPGVTKEAMSVGKAVIGTTTGGITEMIRDGETGLLVPPHDVEALAAAMQCLIDSPELRERMERAAQEDAKQYRAEMSIPLYENLFQELVAAKGS